MNGRGSEVGWKSLGEMVAVVTGREVLEWIVLVVMVTIREVFEWIVLVVLVISNVEDLS